MKTGTIFRRTDIWREGDWLDLWSVVHVLSGMSLGFGLHVFPWAPSAAAVIVLLLLVGYEMFETIAHIEETPTNRFMDVVTGMLGYSAVYFFIAPTMSALLYVPAFAVTLALNIGMSVVGWRASQKAATLEEKLRLRIQKERCVMRERSIRFRRRWRRLPRNSGRIESV